MVLGITLWNLGASAARDRCTPMSHPSTFRKIFLDLAHLLSTCGVIFRG